MFISQALYLVPHDLLIFLRVNTPPLGMFVSCFPCHVSYVVSDDTMGVEFPPQPRFWITIPPSGVSFIPRRSLYHGVVRPKGRISPDTRHIRARYQTRMLSLIYSDSHHYQPIIHGVLLAKSNHNIKLRGQWWRL